MIFENVAQRLIVAIDPHFPEDTNPKEVAQQCLAEACNELEPLGVTVKINTVARVLGATAVEIIHDSGLGCFLDLKLYDIGNTVENDADWIRYYSPMMLTASERVKPLALQQLIAALPDTLVLPVGPLTDLDDMDFKWFGNPNEPNRASAAEKFFNRIWQGRAHGAICAPVDIAVAPKGFLTNATIITPAVKPHWTVLDNNSANALTPTKAFEAGADAIVVGRGITAQESVSMREAAKRTLAEVEEALAKRQ